MADKKLAGIKWPNMPNDTYWLDAEKVIYDETETYPDGSTGKALQNKAEIDGSYANMTVGNAEQLVSNVRVNDKIPYIFRTSGGSVDIGDREYVNGIVGGTVAWNQKVWLITTGGTVNGLTYTPDPSTGIVTVDGTSTGRSNIRANLYDMPFISGHKYLVSIGAEGVSLSGYHGSMVFYNDGTYVTYREFVATATIVSYDFNANKVTLEIVGAGSAGVTLSNVKFIPQFFDLTQMFGSTIADYIYSLETATAGAGVAWFKKLFDKPYYAYNVGELKSVNGLVSHDMTGFNQWDEEYEEGNYNPTDGTPVANTAYNRSKNPIRVLPNTTYYVNKVLYRYFYDINMAYVGRDNSGLNTFTTPTNAYYMHIAQYKNEWDGKNTNINLAWDNSRNGEYEPYELHSYPLDSDLTLRGIPKLDANNSLYYDGDVYEPDGTVTRKYGIVDLGTLSWTYISTSGQERFYTASISEAIKSPVDNNGIANITSKYVNMAINTLISTGADKAIACAYNGFVAIRDTAYTDATTFKTALSGVYLVYELATTTTESADPYQQTQIVNDFGTEEYKFSNSVFPVPVGSDTDYPVNLVAKLEMAPNSPDGSGDYIVRQTNGVNEYVPLVIEDALPTMPSTAGTYKLTVTVADGADPVLSWEAE